MIIGGLPMQPTIASDLVSTIVEGVSGRGAGGCLGWFLSVVFNWRV